MLITNQNGSIEITNEVLASICGISAINCFGVKGMAAKDVKDNIVSMIKKEPPTRGVEVSFNQLGQLEVKVHIVVEHGVNIAAVCQSVMSEVRYNVESFAPVKVASVHVSVDGITVD